MEYMSSLQDGFDDHKPSLFELLSEQQLSSLLPPSLRYLLVVATHRHPRYLLRILNSFDELYALLSVLVERHYLTTYGGSFTENFYGLKRERVLRIKGGEVPRAQIGAAAQVRETLKLKTGDVWKNIAVMVGLPYLKRKLDESYDVHIAPQASLIMGSGPTYNRDELPSNATLRQKVVHFYKYFLRNIYPSVNAAYYFSLLLFNLLYLFDNTKYSSPWLWLIGTRIRRLGAADHHAIALANEPKPTEPGRPGQGLSGILSPRTLYPRLLSSLRILLPTSIFALKFLEWWHQSDFSRQLSRKAAEGLDLPPPITSGLALARKPKAKPTETDDSEKRPAPKGDKPAPPIPTGSLLPILTVPPPITSDLCPICLHPISNPAACQTGFVFDYPCIFKWVDGSHPRQEAFMKGESLSEWADGEDESNEAEKDGVDINSGQKEGKWESGKGRCAITGRRVLGGTEGIRRVMV